MTTLGREWTSAEDAQFIAMRDQGHRAKAIAAALNRSVSSVHTRASFLSLPRAPRTPRTRKPEAPPIAHVHARVVRNCMCCRQPFQSQGNHHRLCTICRHIDVGPQPVTFLSP